MWGSECRSTARRSNPLLTSWALGGPQLLDFRVLTAAATEFPDTTLGRLQLHFSGHGLRSGSLWSPGSPQPRLQLDVEPNGVSTSLRSPLRGSKVRLPNEAYAWWSTGVQSPAVQGLCVSSAGRGAGEGRVRLVQPVRLPTLGQGNFHGAHPQTCRRPLSAPETQPRRGLRCVERAGIGHFFETLNYSGAAAALYSFRAAGQHWATFIGASLLTILEILHYLCEVFRDRVLGYFWNQTHSQRHFSTNLLQEGLGSH